MPAAPPPPRELAVFHFGDEVIALGTTREAAQLLATTVRNIYRKAVDPTLVPPFPPLIRTGPQEVRIDLNAVRAWLKARVGVKPTDNLELWRAQKQVKRRVAPHRAAAAEEGVASAPANDDEPQASVTGT